MTAAMTKQEYLASFPVEDVTCATATCGTGGCLIYPDVGQPSTVCPNCSAPAVESFLRFAAERSPEGFKLKAVRVFPEPEPSHDDLFGRMQKYATELADWEREELEVGWHATADGSNCTGEFGYTDDGGVAYFEGGPKPSYALAMLFDFENFMRGADTALAWEAVWQPS
jgi:hypothetical protein